MRSAASVSWSWCNSTSAASYGTQSMTRLGGKGNVFFGSICSMQDFFMPLGTHGPLAPPVMLVMVWGCFFGFRKIQASFTFTIFHSQESHRFTKPSSWWSKCWATWGNAVTFHEQLADEKLNFLDPLAFCTLRFLDLGVKDLVQKDKRQSWKSWKKGMWEKCWSGFWGVWCCDALHCLVREIAGQAYMTKAQSRQLDSSSIVSCRCPFLKLSFICALFLASAFLLDFCMIFYSFLFCNVIALPQATMYHAVVRSLTFKTCVCRQWSRLFCSSRSILPLLVS